MVAALAVVAAAVIVAITLHLSHRIKTVTLPSDVQTQGGGSAAGIAAGAAINILVIGTDARANSADCSLGGACDPSAVPSASAGAGISTVGANADVEMVVHISGDRTNMTVLSIPRDTEVTVPACTGNGQTEAAHTDRINSTLAYGPQCTIEAVHNLTGLAINHFMMVDFSGVVQMSDAVGGVSVCVDNNVYDPYSHLKLAKGTHVLQGVAALEFLRTRHGFGDGSDIGRTIAQHIFLSSLQRRLEAAGTLLNPATVYKLANTATGVITVDTGLGSVTALAQLAVTMSRVPTDRTTFVTMPTAADPTNPNTVVPGAGAQALFTKIATDVSLTATASAKPAASASAGASHQATSTATARATEKATSSASRSSSPTAEATSLQQTSASDTGCAHVSDQVTVQIDGIGMTPIEAYAKSPRVPDSAP